MGNNNFFFESLFKKNAASPDIKEFLKSIVQDHPYFSPAQFYLLLHTEPGTTDYNKQAAVTTALFNNPYWLQFQLNEALELQGHMPLPGALSEEAPDFTESNKIEQDTIAPEMNVAEMASAAMEAGGVADNKITDFTQPAGEDELQNQLSTSIVNKGEERNAPETQSGKDALVSAGSIGQEDNLGVADDSRENFATGSNLPEPAGGLCTDNEDTPSNRDSDEAQPITGLGELGDQATQIPGLDSFLESHPIEITDETLLQNMEITDEDEQLPVIEIEPEKPLVETMDAPLSSSKEMIVKEEELSAANNDEGISPVQVQGQPLHEIERVNSELPGEKPMVDESVNDETPVLAGDETNNNQIDETGELIAGQQADGHATAGNIPADSNGRDANSAKENKPFDFKLNIDVSDTTEEKISFEPLYTTDYFASQGIKISTDITPGDKLGKQLKSFTEWLKTMKKVHSEQLTQVNDATDITIQKLAEHSNKEDEVVTEAMAEVLLQQDKRAKAIEVYQKLSLLNPSKTAYFAAKIDHLKEH